MSGEGRKELRRMEKFNDFLVKEKQMAKKKAEEHAEYLDKATVGNNAEDLVEGLRVTNKQNEVIHAVQNPGEETVTVYRGWKSPQVRYIEAEGAKVGDTVMLEDPPPVQLEPHARSGKGLRRWTRIVCNKGGSAD